MKKKLIIYLLLTKTRKFDFERFDAYEIQKSGTVDFEFHEMADFIYPGFSELFTNDRLSEKKINISGSVLGVSRYIRHHNYSNWYDAF